MRRCMASVGLAAVVVLLGMGSASGLTIVPGFDLFTTTAGTEFNPDGPGPFPAIPFVGVPLGTFDFGGTVGVKPVGTTDTIVERLLPASGPGIDTIPIEMVSLQLESAVPLPLAPFGGVGPDAIIGVTLSSDRGRDGGDPASTPPPATSSMSIDFDAHTFSSSIDIEFDLRAGGVFGPILPGGLGLMDTLVNEDPIVWASSLSGGYFYSPDATERSEQIPFPRSYHKFTLTRVGGGDDDPLQIPGVNDGFLPLVNAPVPEPATLLIWSLLAGLGVGLGWWRRK